MTDCSEELHVDVHILDSQTVRVSWQHDPSLQVCSVEIVYSPTGSRFWSNLLSGFAI